MGCWVVFWFLVATGYAIQEVRAPYGQPWAEGYLAVLAALVGLVLLWVFLADRRSSSGGYSAPRRDEDERWSDVPPLSNGAKVVYFNADGHHPRR